MKTYPLSVRACALLTLVLVQACGGDPTPGATKNPSELRSVHGASVTALLDDQGLAVPSEPSAEPADPGARTRSQRYSSELRAQRLLDAMGDRALRIDTGCCGADAVDVALQVVNGMRHINGLGTDAPVLVHGADQRLAATLVNTLTDAGYTQVWLVTR